MVSFVYLFKIMQWLLFLYWQLGFDKNFLVFVILSWMFNWDVCITPPCFDNRFGEVSNAVHLQPNTRKHPPPVLCKICIEWALAASEDHSCEQRCSGIFPFFTDPLLNDLQIRLTKSSMILNNCTPSKKLKTQCFSIN